MIRFVMSVVFSLGCNLSLASDWRLIPSADAYWIRSSNPQQHELLVAYYQGMPQFLLIIVTDSPPPERPMEVEIQIDRGPREPAQLVFLEHRNEKSIFRLKVEKDEKGTYLYRMSAGLNLVINSSSGEFDAIEFSLIGFTEKHNQLLIANDIGQLDQQWLLGNNRIKELYCFLSSKISIQAVQHRLDNKNLTSAIDSIPDTGFPLLDHDKQRIITSIYKTSAANLPLKPGHKQYSYFKSCMAEYKLP